VSIQDPSSNVRGERTAPKPSLLHPPRWVVILSMVMLLGVGVITISAYTLHAENRRESVEECEQDARGRDDIRALFTSLYEMFPNAPQARQLLAQMDIDYQPFRCDSDGERIYIPTRAALEETT
jgi:hypothetical protein